MILLSMRVLLFAFIYPWWNVTQRDRVEIKKQTNNLHRKKYVIISLSEKNRVVRSFPAKQKKRASAYVKTKRVRRIRDLAGALPNIWFEITLRSSDRHNPARVDRRRSIIPLFPRTLHQHMHARTWGEGRESEIGFHNRSIHRSPIDREPIVSRVTGRVKRPVSLFSVLFHPFPPRFFESTRCDSAIDPLAYRLGARFRGRRASSPASHVFLACQGIVSSLRRGKRLVSNLENTKLNRRRSVDRRVPLSLSLSLLYSSIFVR